MKNPLSKIPGHLPSITSSATMAGTMTAIICVLFSVLTCKAQGNALPADSILQEMPGDTVHTVMPQSDVANDSFFRGLIPPSPNAVALARYAEYPVSHTTGIPDITIPLYEIQLGGFTLPISVSYHASGCRVDEVPTCVGLGWSLNAGGAVTRTILGGPDLEYTGLGSTDYRLRDLDYMKSALSYSNPNLSVATPILTGNPEYDTESDRYSLNAGGHSLLFRYSHNDGEFVTVNHDPCLIDCFGQQLSSYFSIRFPDGTRWTFSDHERTGMDSRGEGMPFTTAWYVTDISTPWGNIHFNYRHGERLDLRRSDISVVAGPETEPDSEGYPRTKERVDVNESAYTYFSGQTLVESITWNGNSVYFDYSAPHPGVMTDRLERMRVVSSEGETLRTVTFGNDTYWASNDASKPQYGRRLLRSLSDSMAGTYTFEYDTRISLPPLDYLNAALWSDLYGYFRGTKNTSVVTQRVMERLREVCPSMKGTITAVADRTPVKSGVTNGLLTKLTLPTGGYVSFAYECNHAGGSDVGGARIASMTTSDGQNQHTTRYSYTGTTTQESPESLMWCDSYVGVDGIVLGTVFHRRRKAFSSPQFSSLQPTCPAAYMQVVETRADNSTVTYNYHDGELAELFGVTETLNPSLFEGALIDTGNRLPLLVSRIVRDSGGNEILTGETDYDRVNLLREFDTGVRTAYEYYSYNFYTGEVNTGYSGYSLYGGHFEMRRCLARVRAATVREKRVIDHRSGMVTTTTYTYDPQLRTTQPKSTTVTDSRGRTLTTTCTYPFERTDAMCRGLVDYGQTDAVVAVRVTDRDKRTLSGTDTEYALFNDIYYPVATRSWSMPTSDASVSIPSTLPERERVSSYNALGRPLSITVNQTDVTSFSWDTHGQLKSMTAPGGLTTIYTHRPLFGVASVTEPSGHTATYEYNGMGLLMSAFDSGQITDSYSYTLVNHPTGEFKGACNSVTSRRYLESTGTKHTVDQQFCDGLGRRSVLAKYGMNTQGKHVYTAQTYDALGRELRVVLPGVGGTYMEAKTAAQVLSMATSTHGDAYAYSETTYDALGRPLKTTTPGKSWHDNGLKGKTTEYVGNKANSVRLYRAPVTSISLVEDGYYAASTLQGVRTVDEDGNEMTVYTDRLGRKVLERRGPESGKGQNDTYFVYNDLGQLRYVLSPGYELSGYKEKFAYEYRYDESGNVVKKFIPGGGYTQYWYDRAGRMTFMQDPNLREQGKHRFFLYDKAGRQVMQGLSSSCNRSEAVNTAAYTGGTSGFQSSGYTLADASRIQQATLETVAYYDGYTFVSSLDSRLSGGPTSVSAKGRQTGSVVYNSEGGKSLSAMYYDLRGNVTQLREVTDFGTLRVTQNTYTFTNQPLTSKTTEESGGQTKTTLLTENTYSAETGLLLHTDVTVNGTRQRVSSLTYDDLGRVSSSKRGGDSGKGGTVIYSYNLQGQATVINGPGFAQTLHYTDGPGKPLYNGSVSSMVWLMNDHRQRGYRYTYNGYGWLTLAEYGEGSTLSSNKDRYTERFLNFMPNGGIRRLQRHGLKADGNYGKVDNLHISYYGNRIASVLEDAADVTQTGSMDYPGKRREMDFGYNEWGALTKDESRGITNIAYDNFGNPTRINFSNGSYTKNVYSADGVKLKTEHYTNLSRPVNPAAAAMGDGEPSAESYEIAGLNKIEYHGPVIYRNGSIDMVQFPGGYATISGITVTFHYYTQDYLGNNRAVVNGTTGAIEQTTAYYPYGAVIADLGKDNTGQPYRFGGKELISANGLNEYDFGARRHYPAIPQFTSIDPLCEKYPWLSPYLYCANNPVNYIDYNGLDIWLLDESGNFINTQSFDDLDMIIINNSQSKKTSAWVGECGTIKNQSFLPNDKSDSYMYFNLEGDDVSTSLFEFLANNTIVEWTQIKTGVFGSSEENYISTSHLSGKEFSSLILYDGLLKNTFIREDIHNHPSNSDFPSGLSDPMKGDIKNASLLESRNRNVICKIYTKTYGYTKYSSKSKISDFPNRGYSVLDTLTVTP
ncbi:MAG: DUF6443 domain-containing protein [Muribaculaceae bacterium]|nr:DUF6443 domain-containing protein [Muribaculaceae bacterium]